MKEIIAFVAGTVVTLIFMKATAMVVSVGSQNLICYALKNPF